MFSEDKYSIWKDDEGNNKYYVHKDDEHTFFIWKNDEGRIVMADMFSDFCRYFETDEDYFKFMKGELSHEKD